MKKTSLLISFIFVTVINAIGNNLQISGITVNQSTKIVSFTVSWENSWRVTSAPSNWDAVWVFVKFKACSASSATAFTHGVLTSITADHSLTGVEAMSSVNWNGSSGITESAVQGTTLDFTDGIMLRRNSLGSGSYSSNVSLKISNLPASGIDITTKVYGIEMVYVPKSDFYIGDGASTSYRFGSTNVATTSTPVLITSAYETAPSTFSCVTSVGVNIPAAWPKGNYGFYLMKYEITQGAYMEFLNSITTTAAAAKYPGNYNSWRNVLYGASGNYSTMRPDRAQNSLNWNDVSAFLDWACLRPITETEYEKACRGTNNAVGNEYAWGNLTLNAATTFSGGEDGTETFTGGNCNYSWGTFIGGDAGNGPCRVGIFATNSSDRTSAGAGYYGAMELSGNVWETVIGLSTATPTANIFTRTWGDGTVDATTGSHNTSTWPIATYAGGASYGNIVGARGGDCYSASSYLIVSDRYYIINNAPTTRDYRTGGRGGR